MFGGRLLITRPAVIFTRYAKWVISSSRARVSEYCLYLRQLSCISGGVIFIVSLYRHPLLVVALDGAQQVGDRCSGYDHVEPALGRRGTGGPILLMWPGRLLGRLHKHI